MYRFYVDWLVEFLFRYVIHFNEANYFENIFQKNRVFWKTRNQNKTLKALLDAKLLAKLFSKVIKNNLIYLIVYRVFYRKLNQRLLKEGKQ